ncbi:MAG: hypothetical protein GYB67_02390 [Chloroflexi bacterium]|nr:hypothetical protein [Chloroflexota bacterium]
MPLEPLARHTTYAHGLPGAAHSARSAPRRALLALLILVAAGVIGAPVVAQTAPGIPAAPLVGPLIAADSANQTAITLYDVGSQTIRRLAFGAGWHHVWGFSADGCRLIYTLSDGPALPKLYSARLDGSDPRALVQYDALPAAAWGIWEPQASPAGDRIAFTMIRDNRLRDGTRERTYHVGWVPAAGGVPEFYSVSGDEHTPRWSPDGAWLAYVAYEERVAGATIFATAEPPPPDSAGSAAPLLREADLWVVGADGSNKDRLTNFPTGSVQMPAWSPDGDLIGFVYAPSPSSDQFWMIGNAAGAIPTQLSFEPTLVLDITWLPDSTALLTAARHLQNIRANQLWQIPLVGSADTDATLYPLAGEPLSHVDFPRFSADGRWLVVRSAYALALIDTEVRAWSLLAEMPLGNTPAVWSPAGFDGEAACPA